MFWNKTNFITRSLPFYDALVNKINCHYVWKCNEKHIFEHYLKNIGRNHLEIGPGTGYFLQRRYPISHLTLMDINQDTLDYTRDNLKGNYPHISVMEHDIFKKPKRLDRVQSVGINYVLHCVPGRLDTKLESLVKNIHVDRDTTFFGATVIQDDTNQTFLSKTELYLLNKYKIFHNQNDYIRNGIDVFEKHGFSYDYNHIGNVFLFSFKKKG